MGAKPKGVYFVDLNEREIGSYPIPDIVYDTGGRIPCERYGEASVHLAPGVGPSFFFCPRCQRSVRVIGGNINN